MASLNHSKVKGKLDVIRRLYEPHALNGNPPRTIEVSDEVFKIVYVEILMTNKLMKATHRHKGFEVDGKRLFYKKAEIWCPKMLKTVITV